MGSFVIRSNQGASTDKVSGLDTPDGFIAGSMLFDSFGNPINPANPLPTSSPALLLALADLIASQNGSKAELESIDDTTARGFLLIAGSLSKLLASQNPANELRISVQNGTITTVSTITTVGTVTTVSTLNNIAAIGGISPTADQWYASRAAANSSYSRIA